MDLTTHLHCHCPVNCIRAHQPFAFGLGSTRRSNDWQRTADRVEKVDPAKWAMR
jgi:hypothetical protein